jgi:hypothetical protein
VALTLKWWHSETFVGTIGVGEQECPKNADDNSLPLAQLDLAPSLPLSFIFIDLGFGAGG